MLWYVDRWKDLLQVEYDFKASVKTLCGEETLHAIEYLDMAIVDFEGANKKYLMQLSEKRSLFDDASSKIDYEEVSFSEMNDPEEMEKKMEKRVKKAIEEKKDDLMSISNVEDYV
jgi:hypothetical protein